MKANRKFVNDEDAVSPVIAVILMVAITVVLAATVYLWVSGFGANQKNLVNASFAAKSIDLPLSGTDSDTNDDALQLTFASADKDPAVTDVTITVDGVQLTWDSTNKVYAPGGAAAASAWCTTIPGGSGSPANFVRGSSVYLFKLGSAGVAGDCSSNTIGSPLNTHLSNMKGIHNIQVSVLGQVVLDTSAEVHDDATA